MKICNGPLCNGAEKPLEAFNKNKTRKDGLQSRCRECQSDLDKKWREENSDLKRASGKRYRLENQERIRARRAERKDEKAEWYQAYYAANREQVLEANRQWRKSNPEKVKRIKMNYVALKREAGELPKGAIEAMFRVYDYKCMKPGCEVAENLHLDHIVPLSLGGANELNNLQFLCQHHNTSKSNRNEEDYRPWPRLVDTQTS